MQLFNIRKTGVIAVLFALCGALLWNASYGADAKADAQAGAKSGEEQMLQMDRAFVAAAAKGDKQSLGKLLDTDFTWTNSDGKTLKKSEVMANMPKPGIADLASTKTKHYIYGELADVQSDLGRVHELRVWVKRPAGWKAIVYQEVTSLENAPTVTPGAGKDCENPCRSVSYDPKNETEKQVVAAYEHLETAAMAHNSAVFSTLVADEFVAASSNSNKVYDKRGRMEDFDHSKMAGVAPTPLSSGRMFDFPGAVLMTSLHQPDRGKPLHVTRIWVKRNGNWVEAVSYQTSIQGTASSGQ
jgi:hypothetical protein